MICDAFWRRVLLTSLGLICACDLAPTFDVRVEKDAVTVDCRQLSEYPSTVTRVLLRDLGSGEVLWELRRVAGTPQVHEIRLTKGENPRDLASVSAGVISAVTPSGALFRLGTERDYELTVWGETEAPKAKKRFRFRD